MAYSGIKNWLDSSLREIRDSGLYKDEKLIKLPPENYKESIVKFLEIYEKSAFKKFKVFDFRIKNQLIMR